MRLRVLVGFLGLVMGSFGLLRFLQHDLADIVDTLLWLIGGVVIHDAFIAPLTLAVTALGTRLVPRRAWLRTSSGLIVLLTVTATAIPVLGSWGARPDNATLLDRNYTTGWFVFAALVLLAGLIPPLGRRLVSHSPKDREAG